MLFKNMSEKPLETNNSDQDVKELTPVQQILVNTEKEKEAAEPFDPNELLMHGEFGKEVTEALKEVFAQPEVKIKNSEIIIANENIKDKTYIYSGNDKNLIPTIMKVKDSKAYSKVAVYLSSENINNDTIIKFLRKENVDVILTTSSLKTYLTNIQG